MSLQSSTGISKRGAFIGALSAFALTGVFLEAVFPHVSLKEREDLARREETSSRQLSVILSDPHVVSLRALFKQETELRVSASTNGLGSAIGNAYIEACQNTDRFISTNLSTLSALTVQIEKTVDRALPPTHNQILLWHMKDWIEQISSGTHRDPARSELVPSFSVNVVTR